MTDLILVLVSGEVMERNLERSLGEANEKPWAFKDWKRQMQALQPGRAIAFVDMVDDDGRQVTRFTSSDVTYACRRAIVGTLRSPVGVSEAPFFEGYPYEFGYSVRSERTFTPAIDQAGLAEWLGDAVPGLSVEPDQLHELVLHAKSNKIGVFIDGAPRMADYFPTATPRARPRIDRRTGDDVTSDDRTSLGSAIEAFGIAVRDAGLTFLGVNEDLPSAFLAALVAKRFAILSGLSGSGKTRLAQALGQWLGPDAEGRPRYVIVPVRPDWTSPDHLLGYEDALLPVSDGRRAWAAPEPLRFMLRAAADPRGLYLLVLDEMNLAHVERYFADVLSGSESGEPVLPALEPKKGYWRLEAERERIPVPRNLLVVGTVNVDETTYQFSPKVLDRAFSFDFRVSTDEIGAAVGTVRDVAPAAAPAVSAVRTAAGDPRWHVDTPGPQADEVRTALIDVHRQLASIGFEFGHRTFVEAMRFTAALAQAGIVDSDETVDWVVMAKVLPRLHGSRRLLEPFLEQLRVAATGGDSSEPPMPRTARKVQRLLDLARANQFVSFAE